MNTLEQSIENNPEEFAALIDKAEPEVKQAMEELSVRLDAIFGAKIRAYADERGIEVSDGEAFGKDYREMNRIICGMLDKVIGAHIKEKRSNM